ncbi:hypothetical protein D3C71_2037630 [compost metagenome]
MNKGPVLYSSTACSRSPWVAANTKQAWAITAHSARSQPGRSASDHAARQSAPRANAVRISTGRTKRPQVTSSGASPRV